MAQPTFEDVLIAGIARSGKSRNQQLASNTTEMLAMMKRSQRTMFALAARANPFFFGKLEAVAKAAGTWAWPSDMELLFRLEYASVEAVIVPIDQKNAEPSKPALYPLGTKLYSAGGTLDPTTGPVTFYYSRRPVDPDELTSEIDADFPESHLDVLILDVATYLATKDGRGDDRQAFMQERGSFVALFLAHLEHATASIERRKYGQIRRFSLDTLNPTGGSGVAGVGG